jgi:hypothetical protein
MEQQSKLEELKELAAELTRIGQSLEEGKLKNLREATERLNEISWRLIDLYDEPPPIE